MRIPKTFQLAGAEWKVVQIPDYNVLGLCNRDIRTIFLKQNIPKELKEQTFCHELVHAIKYMMGEDDHDEKQTDVFATFLHHYLNSARYL